MAQNQPKARLRKILLGGALIVLIIAAGLFASKDARRATELRAAEVVGELATRVIAAKSGAAGGAAADFISIPIEVRKLDDIVFQARGVANTQVIATSAGHVVFDTGLATQAAKQRRLLDDALPPGPITHVVLSHSHQDHVGGTRFWVDDETEIVAHRAFAEEQRYLLELQDFLWTRNRMLFPFMPETPPKSGFLAYGGIEPTLLVDEQFPLRFEQGGVRFEVLSTPGAEGLDNLCLWLPDQKILFSGDTLGPNFPQFPNVFTMRGEKVRKPIEYIDSLDKLIALEAEMLVPSHQDPILGRDRIRAGLIRIRDAVRYVHDATIEGMNAGKTVDELMTSIELPEELALSQLHGRVSWAVKSIWEYYATWFHFDSTTELYAVPVSSIQAELAALAGVDAIVERAARHVEVGENLEALHLLEVALAGDPNHRAALETRLAALEDLLQIAKSTFQNSYEMDWLKYRIRSTQRTLAEAVP
jgi:alkyl sulfatase BDS1-like metallo-beta-lactamase superfamily hydrolase